MMRKEIFFVALVTSVTLKQLHIGKDAKLLHNKCIANFLDSDYKVSIYVSNVMYKMADCQLQEQIQELPANFRFLMNMFRFQNMPSDKRYLFFVYLSVPLLATEDYGLGVRHRRETIAMQLF